MGAQMTDKLRELRLDREVPSARIELLRHIGSSRLRLDREGPLARVT
jgi:hypothetical protein